MTILSATDAPVILRFDLKAQPLVGDVCSPVGCSDLLAANNSFTESRINTISVKTPKTVPNGMKMHSMAATTVQKTCRLC
jgi:hypothetical protein